VAAGGNDVTTTSLIQEFDVMAERKISDVKPEVIFDAGAGFQGSPGMAVVNRLSCIMAGQQSDG